MDGQVHDICPHGKVRLDLQLHPLPERLRRGCQRHHHQLRHHHQSEDHSHHKEGLIPFLPEENDLQERKGNHAKQCPGERSVGQHILRKNKIKRRAQEIEEHRGKPPKPPPQGNAQDKRPGCKHRQAHHTRYPACLHFLILPASNSVPFRCGILHYIANSSTMQTHFPLGLAAIDTFTKAVL